jgi:hypothetical protein
MSTLLDISSSVKRNLDDLNSNFFSVSDDINPAIQDGYNIVAALTEAIESYATVDFISGKVFYDFKSLIPTYLRIFGIYNNNTNRWMYPVSFLELYKMRDNWELAAGDPYLFVPINYRTVALFPSMPTATGTMTVMFKATAETLTANAEPQLPQENHNILEYYSTSDMLEQAEEFAKATEYFQKTEIQIENIKKVLRNRTSPNQIYYKHEQSL